MPSASPFNPRYQVIIRKTTNDGSGTPDLEIYAPLSEQFMYDSSAEYEPAFGNLFGGGLLKALNVFGTKPMWQAMTAQVWTGTSTDDITLKFVFQAERDAYQEVTLPVYRLESLVAAGTNKIGLLTAPVGGIDFGKVLDYISKAAKNASEQGKTASITSNALEGASAFLEKNRDSFQSMEDGRNPAQNQNAAQSQTDTNLQFGTREWLESMMTSKVSIQIGTQIHFDNIVPLSVSKTVYTQPDARGFMQYCEVDFRFRPMFLVTRADLAKIFGIRDGDRVEGPSGTAGKDTTQTVDPGYDSQFGTFPVGESGVTPAGGQNGTPLYLEDQPASVQNYF